MATDIVNVEKTRITLNTVYLEGNDYDHIWNSDILHGQEGEVTVVMGHTWRPLDERVTWFVTMTPNSAAIASKFRLENQNPYEMGYKIWNNARYKYAEEMEWIIRGGKI